MSLTYESFDSKWLDLHIDKQATVCFYQGWSQSNGWLRITQFDDTIDNTVNKAKKKTQSSHTGLPLNTWVTWSRMRQRNNLTVKFGRKPHSWYVTG